MIETTRMRSPAGELSACPFCGKDDRLRVVPYTADDDGGEPFKWGFTVQCSAMGFDHDPRRGCGSCGGWGETTGEAIAAWNRRALLDELDASKARSEDWKDDPASDDRWNAGLDFAMEQLCSFLGVDPKSVVWDAATETVDGDVQSVMGNIFRQRYGEDWSPRDASKARIAEVEGVYDDTDPVMAGLQRLSNDGRATDQQRAVARAAAAEILKLRDAK
jgi:hypothetical protein